MNQETKPTTSTKAPNWRDFERGNEGVKSASILKVELHLIRVKPGFNPRDLNKVETQEKIERIKDAYKAGRYVPPIEVSLGGADFVDVVDGHCRYEAAIRADTEMRANGGEGIQALTVLPFKGNDADMLIHTIVGNEGEKLVPMEVSDVLKRLTNLGWSAAKIAETFSYSVGWVNKLLFMSTMPEEVKGLVLSNAVSVDVAVAKVKELGQEAGVALKELIAEVNKPVEEPAAEPAAEAEDKPTGEWTKPKPVAPAVKVTTKNLKKADKPAKSKTLDVAAFLAVREMAFSLPELPVEAALFNPTAMFTIEVSSETIRCLADIKELFTGEEK